MLSDDPKTADDLPGELLISAHSDPWPRGEPPVGSSGPSGSPRQSPAVINRASSPRRLTSRVERRRPQRWINTYQRNLACTDLAIIIAMVFASQTIRLDSDATVAVRGDAGVHGISYYLLSAGLVILWMAALGINGVWDKKILGIGPSEYRRIIQASFYLFGFIAIFAYMFKVDVARSYLAMALPLGLFGLIGGRWVWRLLLREHRRTGSHMNTVLVIGDLLSASGLASRLRQSPNSGYRVAGLCVPKGSVMPERRRANSAPTGSVYPERRSSGPDFVVLGHLDDVPAAIEKSAANTVAVSASEHFGSEEVRQLAWQLEGTGVELILAPALTDVAGPRIHIKPVAGLPLMHVQEPQFRGPKLVLKTALDLIVAGLAVIALSPILLVVAALIKLDDHGPVFFRHERVGLGGNTFYVWKFRSMGIGADRRIDEVKTASGQEESVFYKSANDPRITKIGRFIRRTSIDELPQLFNVLGGRMSVVGPRPLVPGEGAEIGNFLERRMLVRPGITGLWQVSGRSDVNAEERIRLDFYYVENWSVAGDLLIMMKTVRAVLAKEGAY